MVAVSLSPPLARRLHPRDLHYGLDSSLRHLAHNGARDAGEPACRLSQIPFTLNVIAVEDAPCLVAGNLHRDPLRNPRPDHVPHSRPAEVTG